MTKFCLFAWQVCRSTHAEGVSARGARGRLEDIVQIVRRDPGTLGEPPDCGPQAARKRGYE